MAWCFMTFCRPMPLMVSSCSTLDGWSTETHWTDFIPFTIYIYQNGATANSSTSEGRCDWLLYTFPKSCVNFGSCWFSSWIFQTSGGWCGSQIVGVYAPLQVHSGLRKIAKGPGRDTWWDSRLQLLGVQSGRIFHGKSGGKASCYSFCPMSEAYIKKNHRLVSTKVGQCQY